jgi:hypothetical protein
MPLNLALTEPLIERSGAVEVRSLSGLPQVAATAAVPELEPPWITPPDVDRVDWAAFAVYPHHLAAHIVSGLLENEGLPTIVTAWTAFPDVASATVWVPKHLMHRARWIEALAPPGDAELLFLATGELSGNDAQGQ